MKKRIIAMLSVIAIIGLSSLAYTDEIDQIREKYDKINTEKEAYKEKLDGNKLLLDKANKEIAEIDSQISELNLQLREVEESILESRKKSDQVQKELSGAEEDLGDSQEALGERLNAMYKNSEVSYIEVILGSKDLVDLFDRINMVKSIVSYDREIVEEIKLQKEKLKELRESLEREEKQYKSHAVELEQKKLKFDNLSKSKEAILQGLRETQSEYEAKVNTLSRESQRVESEISRLESISQEQASVGQNSPPNNSSSGNSSKESSTGTIIAVGNQQGNPNVLTPFNSNITEYPSSSGSYYGGRIPNIDFSHTNKRGPMTMKATAYDPSPEQNGGYGGISATGTALRPGVIAVDPSVIALGTRVYIEYPDGSEMGYFVAEDTGGAIKGNRIDILFMTGAEARQFGVRNMNVYILE